MISLNSIRSLNKKVKNGLVAVLFLGAQVGFATAPFLPAMTAHAAPVCTVDTAGANDEPGQKDLNKLCVDYAGLPTTVSTTWNWDETGTSGANTMDACNLFDTDGDGNINYSVCVTTTGDPAAFQTLTTYSCGDAKADRCTSPATVVSSGTTSCGVSQVTNDPFPGPPNSAKGDSYPKDTQGNCTVQLSTVGGASAKLIDVCSYPSAQPNSDPSDCVIAQPKAGKLEVIKDLVPNSDTGLFNLQVDAVTKATDVGDNGTTGEVVVPEGNHSVGETAGTSTSLASYDSSISCRDLNGTGSVIASGSGTSLANIPIADGTDVVCTVTNNRNSGTITLIKSVTNDNGGTAGVNDFGLSIGGTSVTSGQTLTLPNGSYALNEVGSSGYQFVSLTGTGCPTQLGGSVTLSGGQNITCTITNDDIAPQLTVIKHVVNDSGGTKTASDFTMNVTGTNVSDSSFPGAESPGTTVTLNAGSYSVSEGPVTGYAGNFSADCSGTITIGQTKTCTVTNDDIAPKLTITKIVVNDDGGTLVVSDFPLFVDAIQVTSGVQNDFSAATVTVSETGAAGYTGTIGGDCALDGSITLQVGGVYACTITNDDQPAKITVNKIVVNDNGGSAVASDFTLKVNGTTVVNGVTNTFPTNASYTVSEVGVTGYTQTSLVCKDADTDAVLANPFTPTVGQEVVCTITNDDVAPTLKLVKTVVNNNGGTATTANFQGKISGTNVAWDTAVTKDAGAYTASETVLAGGEGYTASSWGGDCASNGNITLNVGDVKTCTITNDDQAATLILVKNLPNDNGGVATEADFSVFIDGNQSSWGQHSVDAGQYKVSETTLPGYSPSTWGTDCDADGDVTLALGETKTCAITNDDQPGSISGVKCEVNSDATSCPGGTGLEYWTIYNDMDDNDAFDPNIDLYDVTDVNGAYTIDGLNPGTYTLREVNPTDWTQIFPGSPGFELSVTIGQGENSTNNNFGNFKNGSINGYKWNDINGDGTKDTSEPKLSGWTINLSGAKSDSTQTDQNGDYSFTNLAPGAYTVCEQSQAGWVQTSTPTCHNITIDTSGESAEANFGNQGRGTITVVKNVDVDGDGDVDFKDVSDWTWDIDGSGDFTTGSGNPQVVAAGSYDVSEDQLDGWTLTDIECSSEEEESEILRLLQANLTNSVENGTTVVVAPGEDVTCVFTNTRDTGTITVNKELTPTTNPGKFNLNINGTTYVFNVGDDGTTGAISLVTGTYTASETAGTNTNLSDYETSYECKDGDTVVAKGNTSSTAQLQLGKNQDIVCTFYNNKGQILSEEVPVLVDTGSNILGTSFVGLLLIGAVGGLAIATRRATTARS
jgi:hypothetical protein